MHTHIVIKPFVSLTRIELQLACDLLHSVWPTDNSTRVELSKYLDQHNDRRDCHVAFQLSEGGCQAHGEIFYRKMSSNGNGFTVACLASVCVAADMRGRGLGLEIVGTLFRWSQNHLPAPILFQTGVAEFYEKLGCKKVNNVFINSTSPVPDRSPWWDKHIMVYDPRALWPTGVVDLNGPGF